MADSLVFISEEKHKQLARSEVLPGDVLLTKAGHILGYSAVLPESLSRGNITSHLVSIRPTDAVIPGFLAFVLSSTIGKQQIYRWGNKSTRPELNTDEVREILIPLPVLGVQRELTNHLEEARAERRRKTEQASVLLSGMDDLLFGALGMQRPNPDSRRAYAVRTSTIVGSSRLGADYYHPERMNWLGTIGAASKINRALRLGDIADFRRDATMEYAPSEYLGLAGVQSHTGELQPTSDEAGEGQAFRFTKDDILFARLRPYLNKVWRAESEGVCSTEFHVIRIKDAIGEILPEFLAAILRSSIVVSQTRHMMTGNTHPRLANDDVANLIIPIPDMGIQVAVADELLHRRQQARLMVAEAINEWDTTVADFETALLCRK